MRLACEQNEKIFYWPPLEVFCSECTSLLVLPSPTTTEKILYSTRFWGKTQAIFSMKDITGAITKKKPAE